MREAVLELWPEIAWIRDEKLRESVLQTWISAFENSPLTPDDLNRIGRSSKRGRSNCFELNATGVNSVLGP